MRTALFRFGIAGVLACFVLPVVSAATFNIANGDVTGLINAINTANSNGEPDTINLATNGTYTLTAVNNTTSNGANGLPAIRHESSNVVSDLIINGNGATLQRSTAGGTAEFAFFEITARVTISNLTMQHGRQAGGSNLVEGGGAIRLAAALNTRLTVTGCTFRDDAGTHAGMFTTSVGGAIYNMQTAPMVVTSSTFDSCFSIGGGGAIYNASSGSLSLIQCTFSLCNSGGGSGCVYTAGNATVQNCSFSRCGSAGGCTVNGCSGPLAGALYFAAGTSTVSNSLFSQCIAVNEGGAIINASGSTLTVTGSTFDSNQVAVQGSVVSQGGAIFNFGSLTISNSTFYNNSVGTFNDHNSVYGQGGAIANHSASGLSLTVTNCTFKDNSAFVQNNPPQSDPGGASIYNATNANAIAANNIFTGSHPPELLNAGTFTSQGHNLSDDAAGGDGSTRPGGYLNATGDIRNTNPQLDPNNLQDHGGPTVTIALLAGSPAIDHSNDANAPMRDQRYYSRSGVSDIGAFEYQGSLVPTSAVSRKVHGNDATVFFDVPLPLTGPIGVECRRSTGSDTTGPNVGHDHQIIVTYPYPVAIDSATSDQGVTIDPTPSGFNQVYTLNLHGTTGLPQRLTLTLTNVHDNGASGNSFQDMIALGLLTGDTSGNGIVNASDVSQTKLRSGQIVDNTNFRSDITLNGSINASDVSLVKSKSGTALP